MCQSRLWRATAIIAALGFLSIPLGSSDNLRAEVRPDRLSWERLNGDGEATWAIAARTRVPGGWLVAVRDTGVTFYPDPGHQWGLGHQHPEGRTLEQRREVYIKSRLEQLRKTYLQSADAVQRAADEFGELARDSFALDTVAAKARQRKALSELMEVRRGRNHKESELRGLQRKSVGKSDVEKSRLEAEIARLVRELKSLEDRYRQQRKAFERMNDISTDLLVKQNELEQLKQRAAQLKSEMDQLESLVEAP